MARRVGHRTIPGTSSERATGEVAEATRRLVEVLDVVAIFDPYPDRGASVLVRVYLEVRLHPSSPTTSASPGRPARRSRRALP